MAQILDYALAHPDVPKYLPDFKDLRRCSRRWLINVIRTVVGLDYESWIDARIRERNAAVVKDRKMTVTMEPAVYQAFMASSCVSRKYLVSLLLCLIIGVV